MKTVFAVVIALVVSYIILQLLFFLFAIAWSLFKLIIFVVVAAVIYLYINAKFLR